MSLPAPVSGRPSVPCAVLAQDPLSLGGVLRPLEAAPTIEIVQSDGGRPPAVVVIVLDSVDEAALARARAVAEKARILVVAGRLGGADLAALAAAGADGVLRRTEATPGRLVDAVLAVAAGRGTVPADLLLAAQPEPAAAVPAAAPPGARRSTGRAPLSEREAYVLGLLAEGLSTVEIAAQLAYSERTIKSIVHDVTARWRLRNRTHAVAYAVRHQLI